MQQTLFDIYLSGAVGLTIIYAVLILTYRKGWRLLPEFLPPSGYRVSTKITVIIPARNEEENILACLRSVSEQKRINPALYEVIVIDDYSADRTAELVQSLNSPQIRLLPLQDYVASDETQSFKKKAVEIAVAQATGDLIVCTDADCIVPPDWLYLLAAYYELGKVEFIAAPVMFHRENNALQRFQTLDFLGMMCVTGAGIHTGLMHMCNGANLAYSKRAFEQVGGFAGIDHLASGDDMLLLHKIVQRYPKKIGFLKNQAAVVHTEAKATYNEFYAQRLRWATKSAGYRETQVTLILAAVFFHCCSIVFGFLLIPFFGKVALYLFLFQLFTKSFVDFIYLRMMSQWFDKQPIMRFFPLGELMHILYIVIIGMAGNFIKKYEWKGRKVR